MIGLLMRLYRRSPFYPHLGKYLARVLAFVTRRRAGKAVLATVDGVRYELDLAEVIDSSLYFSGTFEVDAERVIVEHLGPGMTAIDIGANIGYHTFRMARAVGPSGRVVAIEPMSQAFGKLMRNRSLNSFTNIEAVQAGLSDQDCGVTEVTFQSSYRLDGRTETASERVPVTTLDSLLDDMGLDRIDFIKMDVDGYEGKVLRGASQMLERHRPALFFEVTPTAMLRNGDDVEALVRQLTSLGYSFTAEDGSRVPDLLAFCRNISGEFSANVLATTAG